jgi:glucose/arabinose dehydrogenase/mono/diheme cytochrome c family protein
LASKNNHQLIKLLYFKTPFLMIKNFILCIFSLLFILNFSACNNSNSSLDYDDIPSDSLMVEKGKAIFFQNCSACHDFRQDGIGPQLGGLTSEVSAEWLQNFIKGPQSMVESGDDRAKMLYERYNTYMPSFAHFGEEEINAVIAYLHTLDAPVQTLEESNLEEVVDPIPEPIELSNLVVELEQITQIPASSENNPLARIAKIDDQPGTNDIFVVDLRGKLYQLQDNGPQVYMDMERLMPNFINQPGLATGFGSFAFHPEFSENGLLYTTHTESPGSGEADFAYADSIKVTLQWVISEWKTENPASFPFEGERKELFRVNMVTGVHGVQELTFNPFAQSPDKDYGLLYIGIGDGGSVGAGYPHLVQSLETMWGKIIRIDPQGTNSKNGQYGIPEANPFRQDNSGNALGEIFAMGFRNPHRISWTTSGDILASNIGQSQIESLYKILPGHNYGWPIREGIFLIEPKGDLTKIYPLPPDDASYNITYPVVQYSHREGNAISGGFEYLGKTIPELEGKYIFGDIVKARLFYIEVEDIRLGSQAPMKELQLKIDGKRTSFGEMFDNKKVDIRFGRDHLGELWVSSKIDGKVYRITDAFRE